MKTIVSTIIIVLLSCTSFVYAQQNLPSNFPEHQNTGDKKADNAAYDQAKKAWVEANSGTYRKMNEQLKAKPTTETQNPTKKEGIAAMIPDNDNYDEAKKAWIAANPEAYLKMGGQPQAKPVVNENPAVAESENCESTEESAIVIPDNCMTWEVTDVEIIDGNNQLKSSELTEQQADFKEEMLAQKTLWKISPDGILYILNDDQYTNHFKFEKTDSELKLFPHDDSSCNNEVKKFQIEKWTNTQIIINMPDEDEGSTLTYQLILTP